MTLLAIAVGSSNIRIGVFEEEQLTMTTSMRVDAQILPDEYAVKLQSALALFGCDPQKIDGAILCSVTPPLTGVMRQAVARLTRARLMIVGPGLKTGLQIRINDPAQLGADLAVCAAAALDRYEPPMIVASFGTAAALMALDQTGALRGGAIMPGLKISLEALAARTAQLPQIDLERPPKAAIGANTVDAMTSGLIYGAACAADGMARRMEEELGQPAKLIATGSFARIVAPHCLHPLVIEEDLIMEGLRLLYLRNVREPKSL